jgi:hypothetical protein
VGWVTLPHILPSILVPGPSKTGIGQDMTKDILSQVFVVIRMTLITLLIPCAIKMLGTRGWHPKYSNITPNNVYHVCFVHLTSLAI